jgi:hypothetical protein
LALVGLLAAAFAAPAVAQEGGFAPSLVQYTTPAPMPQAPMPHEKAEGRVQIELTFDANNEAQLQWNVAGAPVMPPPRRPDLHKYAEYGRVNGPLMVPPCPAAAPPVPVMPQPHRPDLRAIVGYEVVEYSTTPPQLPPCPVAQPLVVRQFGTGCGSLAPQGCAPVPRVTYTRNHDIHDPFPAAPQGCLPATVVTNERNFDLVVVPAAPPAHQPQMHPSPFVIGVNGVTCPVCPAAPIQMEWRPAPQPCPAPACPQSARQAPPDATKQMAADAFGELLLQSGATAPTYPPCPLPQMRTITVTAVAQPKPAVVGTWYRDLGAKRCVIAVEHDHMTITVSESREIDEKTVTAHITFTADYHLARDGSTAVGLITSVDMSFDGDVPERETDTMTEALAEFRKTVEDRPFAMNCRLYGQTLVIGNVRMPEWKDHSEQPSAYIAGRYTSATTKPMPPQKAMKTPDARAMPAYAPPPCVPVGLPLGTGVGPAVGASIGTPLPLPPGGYATLPSGNMDLLPPPTPGLVPSVLTPEVAPSMPEPTPPMPTMSEPTPPSLSANDAAKPTVASDMGLGWKNRVVYLPDPTRNGESGPGIVGQLFLFGGSNQTFVDADGMLTVDLIDETPRPAGRKAATPERWQFSKESLLKLRTEDETFGKSYVLFLPWPGYKRDIRKVKISARYDQEKGHTLHARPTVVNLAAPAPTMSEPTTPSLSANDAARPDQARIAVPPLGPLVMLTDPAAIPLVKGPDDHKQLFNFSTGLFGGDAAPVVPPIPTLESLTPLPPPPGLDATPPVADGSFLRGLTEAKPARQLFSFTTGLFGSP